MLVEILLFDLILNHAILTSKNTDGNSVLLNFVVHQLKIKIKIYIGSQGVLSNEESVMLNDVASC